MGYDPKRHHRRSVRLRGWDYAAAGWYGVTICVQDGVCVFGEVVDGRVRLSTAGAVAQACWAAIPEHHPRVVLDAFVVMPNHVHGIIGLQGPAPFCTDPDGFSGPGQGALGTVVGSYKAAVSRHLRRAGWTGFRWQRSYFEHVIRTARTLRRQRRYIAQNPLRWRRGPHRMTDAGHAGKMPPFRRSIPMPPDRLSEALARFDAANAEDPNTDTDADGSVHPKELLYARRMTERLDAFAPDASEPLRLAVRAQHIRRWTIPREAYPMDRIGYKRWRTDLLKFHAETAAEILRDVGYDAETVERVQQLLRKRRLKRDPDVQTLEDVVCLVFLDHYFADFAEKHDDEKLVGILRKTWHKMSPAGREAALALDLPPETAALVQRAVAEP